MFYNPPNRLSPLAVNAMLPQNVSQPARRHEPASMISRGVRRLPEATVPPLLSRPPEGALARLMRQYGM